MAAFKFSTVQVEFILPKSCLIPKSFLRIYALIPKSFLLIYTLTPKFRAIWIGRYSQKRLGIYRLTLVFHRKMKMWGCGAAKGASDSD